MMREDYDDRYPKFIGYWNVKHLPIFLELAKRYPIRCNVVNGKWGDGIRVELFHLEKGDLSDFWREYRSQTQK